MNHIKKIAILLLLICLAAFLYSFIICKGRNNKSSQVNISYKKSTQNLGDTRSFGIAIGDVDLDNDMDILIANYIGPTKLWLNNGKGTFKQSNQIFNVQEVHDVANMIVRLRNVLGNCKIIVVTSAPTWRDAREAFKAGAFDYIHKTSNTGTLSRIFVRALNSK